MNRETRLERSDTLVVVDRSRRNRNLAIGAFVAVAVLLAGYFLIGHSRKQSAAASSAAAGSAGKGGQVPTVTVVVPGRTQVARVISATGALAARRDQPVGAAGTGGRVTAVLVDAGSWVNAGQTLATVDRSVQTQTAAQLAAAVDSARASAALAQSNYDRAASLVNRGFISKAELESRRAARDQAQAQIRVAQAQLGATRAGIGLLDIRAPTSGLVLQRNLEVGQVIGAGSQGLFRIAKGGEMEMRAQVSQQDLAALKVGMPASVTPIGAQRSVSGTIWQVAPVIDPQSRLGEVRIAIPYSSDIRPGGFADARITSGATTAPILPQSAVLADEDGNYVYVVNAKNQVERRAVKIGNVSEVGVSVIDGLNGTETVVLSAGPFLNPGQKINPKRQAAR
ncbi:efflux RND transporter periplasmic adaptor subunit [Sphingomonas sp. KRR8]|uniref:efflux RND transporter periplasmic adaptor subunit n=1 Tax=Sphingomonas sp. KRR8 TaxID=2942996 RepID=UPI0020222F69|nr:efflux RND transporter periplasmic adaptor subunit [Sphingomonas sp. KRR8]URD60587.1 efflux RND transporter periplasmic adaptor subunit [Sphingomonas sp. KRR8]